MLEPHVSPFEIMYFLQASGTLMNTGHDVRVVLDEPGEHYINITGGPLSYQYRVSEIIIHFGRSNSRGSEHTLDGRIFPAEVSLMTSSCYYLYFRYRTSF